ncbi:hypothetical protein J2127_000504 [Methanococcus voltae]|uniref:hypothetical protein n=1 Tax=Methanococcus voltae TaxID=2188 RepID=UPI001AE7043E|nr:hypothetical protein [Methanococcus voltae]MBP2143349.1 hypothetical protein [Methanococcus voltae]
MPRIISYDENNNQYMDYGDIIGLHMNKSKDTLEIAIGIKVLKLTSSSCESHILLDIFNKLSTTHDGYIDVHRNIKVERK